MDCLSIDELPVKMRQTALYLDKNYNTYFAVLKKYYNEAFFQERQDLHNNRNQSLSFFSEPLVAMPGDFLFPRPLNFLAQRLDIFGSGSWSLKWWVEFVVDATENESSLDEITNFPFSSVPFSICFYCNYPEGIPNTDSGYVVVIGQNPSSDSAIVLSLNKINYHAVMLIVKKLNKAISEKRTSILLSKIITEMIP